MGNQITNMLAMLALERLQGPIACTADIAQVGLKLAAAKSSIDDGLKDCVIGRQRACKKELAAASTNLTAANVIVLKMADDCKGFIGNCTGDVASLETDVSKTIDDVNGCIANCFDNPIRCTANIKAASTDIVLAIEDVANATNDCAVPTLSSIFLH